MNVILFNFQIVSTDDRENSNISTIFNTQSSFQLEFSIKIIDKLIKYRLESFFV